MKFATTADGVRIGYDEAGAGPDVVLVHGITDSHRAWDPLIEPLAATHHVVAIDQRGHGESDRTPPFDALTMAADLGAVVAQLGLRDPLLVGHSLGGVVVTVAAASGTPTRGVINVDQPLRLGNFKAALEPMAPLLRGSQQEFEAALRAMFDVMIEPLAGSEQERLDAQCRFDQEVVLGVWSTVLDLPAADLDAMTEAMRGAYTGPYLALHGSDPGDDYRPWLSELVPGAEIEVWSGHGHCLHLVDPDRFVVRVQMFDDACRDRV